MLLCECPHRAHLESVSVEPPMADDVSHSYTAGIPVELAFELRPLPDDAGSQVAVCAHCTIMGH